MLRPLVCDRCVELIGYFDDNPPTRAYCRACGERENRTAHLERCIDRIDQILTGAQLDAGHTNEISRLLTSLSAMIK